MRKTGTCWEWVLEGKLTDSKAVSFLASRLMHLCYGSRHLQIQLVLQVLYSDTQEAPGTIPRVEKMIKTTHRLLLLLQAPNQLIIYSHYFQEAFSSKAPPALFFLLFFSGGGHSIETHDPQLTSSLLLFKELGHRLIIFLWICK